VKVPVEVVKIEYVEVEKYVEVPVIQVEYIETSPHIVEKEVIKYVEIEVPVIIEVI
jgi:hypothetical protein